MLEPQSSVFLVLLVVVFGALMWWLIVSRRMLLRIIAACLAFIPAMAFGVAAVNSITTTTRPGAPPSRMSRIKGSRRRPGP